MMTDPIADMLTRIRNAVRIELPSVEMPTSKLKCALADTLKREGYVWDWEVRPAKPRDILSIRLKYGPNGERLIQHVQRTSRPGRRVYSGASDLPPVLDGLGVSILSTSKGVVSDREAREMNVGGEVLCTIW